MTDVAVKSLKLFLLFFSFLWMRGLFLPLCLACPLSFLIHKPFFPILCHLHSHPGENSWMRYAQHCHCCLYCLNACQFGNGLTAHRCGWTSEFNLFWGWAVTVQSHTQSLCAWQGLLRTCPLIFMNVVSWNVLWSFSSLLWLIFPPYLITVVEDVRGLLAMLNGFVLTTTAKWRGLEPLTVSFTQDFVP